MLKCLDVLHSCYFPKIFKSCLHCKIVNQMLLIINPIKHSLRIFYFRTQNSGLEGKAWYHPKIEAITGQQVKNSGQSAKYWARTAEIKMSNIAILRERIVFENFELLHKNSSNLVIFRPIHLISFAYGH